MPSIEYIIDSTKIDSFLLNFPVGIKIKTETGFMSGLGVNDWQNIHATVGGVECHVEVDQWDITNDEAVLWVKVPAVSSSADTVVKIETGARNDLIMVSSATVWDDFTGDDGDDPDGDLWTKDVKFGSDYVSIKNNTLYFDSPGGNTNNGTRINSKFILSGDFDIEIDFNIINEDSPTDGVCYCASLGARRISDDVSLSDIQAVFTSSRNWRAVGINLSETYESRVDTTGKLRLVRINGQIKAYYFRGGSWQWAGADSGIITCNNDTSDIYISLFFEQENNSLITSWIDNFTVNSCDFITGYIGEVGDVPAQNVWGDYSAVLHLRSNGADSSPNAADGTLNGAPIFGVDNTTPYISFDGVNDYIDLLRTLSNDFTISFWYNRQLSTIGFCAIIARNVSGDGFQGIAMDDEVDRTMAIDFDTSGSTELQISTPFDTATWYRVDVVRNGTGLFIYRDGVLIDSGTGVTTSFIMETIGYRPVYGSKHPFYMGELFVCDNALSDAWIKATYNSLNNTLLTAVTSQDESASVIVTGGGSISVQALKNESTLVAITGGGSIGISVESNITRLMQTALLNGEFVLDKVLQGDGVKEVNLNGSFLPGINLRGVIDYDDN